MARKLFAQVNDQEKEIVLERSTPSSPWTLAGEGDPDIVPSAPSVFSVLRNGRSMRALVLKHDTENGTVRMRIDGKTYTVKLQSEQQRMMKTLGLDKTTVLVKEIKAPMPGMVLNIMVKAGDTVKKNDPLLVLEAMKMENVIKAPGDATVKSVSAVTGKAVEKGQLLVSFG